VCNECELKGDIIAEAGPVIIGTVQIYNSLLSLVISESVAIKTNL
jgi:hypothetical protein